MDFTFIFEVSLWNTAAASLSSEESVTAEKVLIRSSIISWLWEIVDGLVVLGIILLIIGGLVGNLVSPGVLGGGPSTIGLDGDVVSSSADAEETILTELGSP